MSNDLIDNKNLKVLETEESVSELFDRLFPLNRSILGEDYRKSLEILSEYIPFSTDEFLSGQRVLNWTVPKEWVIRSAYIEDDSGRRIIDYKNNNLHVISYSSPIDAVLGFEDLKAHIFTCSRLPDAIPYTTSYYKERWGFCMSQNQLNSLDTKANYHAVIDSEFVDGKLVVGHTKLRGDSSREILLTSYLCHPSMANNELSGPIVQAMLYQRIKKWTRRKFTYRFVINPETIGSIAYLSKYKDDLKKNIFSGMVFTCLGGSKSDSLRLKQSKIENTPIDYLAKKISLNPQSDFYKDGDNREFRIWPFDPSYGSDERQYCSPGINLPVSQIARKSYETYPEYHTSMDDKNLMGTETLIDTCDKLEKFLQLLEKEKYYVNIYPEGEIKLGDYDLYPTVNSNGVRNDRGIQSLINDPAFIRKVMFMLNYSNGTTSLSYIAEKLNCSIDELEKVAYLLEEKGLIKEIAFC